MQSNPLRDNAHQHNSAPHLLAGLNPAQSEAVQTLDGPVLILAGAGTGKTRVLTTRLAHLLHSGKARPQQILAMTFTNKAAAEMRHRVGQLLQRPIEGWWVGTFHSLAARLLRRHAELVGLRSDFTILDRDDQLRLIKQFAAAQQIDTKALPARKIAGIIDYWKNRALYPHQVQGGQERDRDGIVAHLYQQYQERLLTLNACDFGDLLLHLVTILQNNPAVLAQYHEKFRYLLIDEYQDTNVVQYLWLRLLAQKHRNICCVGDDDQSIYSWRGAQIENILRFEKDFPGARTIRLEQNYRSTPEILAAASHLISHNQGRLGKTLFTNADQGEKIAVHFLWDSAEEARHICEEIETRQRQKMPLNEMAILVRASFQMRAFEERLSNLGIPYRVIGGPRFYERLEIRDALAYLRLLVQPHDDLAFERVVNTPRRGIGGATLKTLHQHARGQNLSLFQATIELCQTDELGARARKSLQKFLDNIARWRGLLPDMPHEDLANLVLEESGYIAMWQQENSPDAQTRLENLKELLHAMKEFEHLQGFLEHVALVSEVEQGESADMVSLMTLHAAKGLEFAQIFLPGWEEGVFPIQRALHENGLEALEEERRLAYVGLTRARQSLMLTSVMNRQMHGAWQDCIPSRFIQELPDQALDVHRHVSAMPFRSRPSFQRAPASQIPKRDPGSHNTGERIFHQKFGYGTVLAADHDRLEIAFDKAGRKKVLAGFVVAAEQAC